MYKMLLLPMRLRRNRPCIWMKLRSESTSTKQHQALVVNEALRVLTESCTVLNAISDPDFSKKIPQFYNARS